MEIISGEEPKFDKNSFSNYNHPNFKPWGLEVNQFCMLMHLSQLCTFIIPLIMWFVFKDQNTNINTQGKNIINWMISLFLYAIIGSILIVSILYAFIMIPLFISLAIASIVFTINGAIKASKGEEYKYPLTIEFIK